MSTTHRLRRIRHVVLDLDGTVYLGSKLFDTALPLLDMLKRLGMGHTFVTNNSSRSTGQYVEHLRAMGLEVGAEQVYNSTQCVIAWLAANMPGLKRLFVLGTEGLKRELSESGYACVDDDAQAVVAGFDTTLSFERLCRAAWWVKQGLPYIATHPDRICPTNEPTVLVDCGSICAAIEAATGRRPDVVLGKPHPLMIQGICARSGVAPGDTAMIGDRLYTDMAMARAAGAMGVLVLTGETTAKQAAAADPPPDLIVADLAAFAALLEAARYDDR